jgi:hypothetical protein
LQQIHFNIAEHLTGSWIIRQLREAVSESCPCRFAILDRNAKFGKSVINLLMVSVIETKRINPACH